jgi:hypothetical protein
VRSDFGPKPHRKQREIACCIVLQQRRKRGSNLNFDFCRMTHNELCVFLEKVKGLEGLGVEELMMIFCQSFAVTHLVQTMMD